jgi:hypothetical protein
VNGNGKSLLVRALAPLTLLLLLLVLLLLLLVVLGVATKRLMMSDTSTLLAW